MNRKIQKTGRILLRIVLFFVLFVFLLLLLIELPPVQNFARKKIVAYLENKLKTEVRIGDLDLDFPSRVRLGDIYVEDQNKDTLLYGGNISVDLRFFRLLKNELIIRNLALENVTAKIKRVLPDTSFNFQFIVDAFMRDQASPNTADTTAMVMELDQLELDNIDVLYLDVVSGSDMRARITHFDSKFKTIDPAALQFEVQEATLRGANVHWFQNKPLVDADLPEEDLAEATEPSFLTLVMGKTRFSDIYFDYRNHVSAVYALLDLGNFESSGGRTELQKNFIDFGETLLEDTRTEIRLGNAPGAEIVEKEAEQELASQSLKPWTVNLRQIELKNNEFRFNNDTEPRQPYGIDYAHISATDFNLEAHGLQIRNDSISGTIETASFSEQSGFVLQELQTEFLYSGKETYLKDLYLKTPGTRLRREAGIRYASIEAIADNPGQLGIQANFQNSYLRISDLLAFAPMLRSEPLFANGNETWYLDGSISGTLNNLSLQNLDIRGLSKTSISVNGEISNLMEPDQLNGSLDIRSLSTTRNDINRLAPIPDNISLPAELHLNGNITGSMGRVNGRLAMRSSYGNSIISGNFANLGSPEKMQYNALVQVYDFQLGNMLGDPQMAGPVTAVLRIKGTGVNPETTNATVEGNIESLHYNGYNYNDISLNGTLAQQNYTLLLDISDNNLDLDIDASGSIAGAAPTLRFTAMLDSIKTQELQLTPDPLIMRGRFEGDFASIDPDNLQGNLLFTKGLVVAEGERLPIDTLTVNAGGSDSGRYLTLRSDVINADLRGQYKLTELGYVIQNNIDPYFSIVPGNEIHSVSPYNFNFSANMRYTPLISVLIPGLKDAEEFYAEGSLATGEGMRASLQSERLAFGANELSGINLKIYTNDSGMHFNGYADRFSSGSALNLYQTNLDAVALNNEVDFRFNIHDRSGQDKYLISGELLQPAPGDISLRLSPDSLLLNYQTWTVPQQNSIQIAGNSIIAENFVISRGTQQLILENTAVNGGTAPLRMRFADFRLATVSAFLKSDTTMFDGVANGHITFRNIMEEPAFTSNLNIADLSFNQDTVGNLDAAIAFTGGRYQTDIKLLGEGNDIAVTGYMTSIGKDLGLNLDLNIRQFDMESLTGMLPDLVTSASGTIAGDITARGTLSEPELTGAVSFDSTSLYTTVLGGPLTIDNETLDITSRGFLFNNFAIRDSAGNVLTLNGEVLTSNLVNYSFDLSIDAKNFRALSTTERDNDIYYGDLYLTADLELQGTETAPGITGSVVIVDGTDFTFVMPQQEPGVVERDGVVEFVDFDAPENDTLFLAYDSLNTTALTGFDVAVNIEVNPEALVNIVVDEANGDFLQLKGDAQLSAGIDPSGNITLTGPYELSSGSYEISFNFLQRRFEIEEGSQIMWLGQPMNAKLDVTAVYEVDIAPLDLVDDVVDESQRVYYLQKLPFQIILDIGGELMQPEISFDIRLPEDRNYNVSGDVESNVRTRLAQLRRDNSEINKQVFAVLLMNRFIGENPFESSGDAFSAGRLARQSVSKLLTEQLNALASGLIGGMTMEFDVASSDDYTTGERRSRTDLNVELSKQLLNDRLTVTVGSDFMLEGPQQSNQRANNLAGNISATYKLSSDGRYLLRFYRTNEYEGLVDGYVIESGIGFIIKVDYNRFREIFRNRKIKREIKRSEKAQTEKANETQPET